MLKLQLKRCEQMAGDTIFAFVIFSQQFCHCSKSHLTLTHSSVGMARSWDFKDKLMSLDPLVTFIVLFREVEAVVQRPSDLGSQTQWQRQEQYLGLFWQPPSCQAGPVISKTAMERNCCISTNLAILWAAVGLCHWRISLWMEDIAKQQAVLSV